MASIYLNECEGDYHETADMDIQETRGHMFMIPLHYNTQKCNLHATISWVILATLQTNTATVPVINICEAMILCG